MADPYVTLGIDRKASAQDIKSAYRKLAKELHPDRNKDNPGASERFSRVTQAYDLLSDADKRAKFDRGEIDADGNPAMPFGMGGGGGNPFGGFGGSRPGRGPGGNGYSAQGFDGFQSSEDIDLGDLFEGLFGRSGGGGGRAPGGGFGRQAPPPPPRRKGANINYKLAVPFIDAATRKKQRITLADGKTIDLSLPAGVEDGTQMRLKGKGRPGAAGAGAGDGIVTIEIQPHAYFSRDGDDVRIDLPITLDEALSGGRVKVPTVDGPVMMTVSAGSNSGKLLRLKGKGFSRKGGGRGDQLVALQIQLPDDTAELSKRLEGWKDTETARKRFEG